MSTPTSTPTLRTIPIALIDEPMLAMREQMSDAGLEALAESMRVHGQLQNIGVVVTGDRYRVVYGHRRRIAAPRAGLVDLLARVFPEGTADEEALKVDENEEQEAVNAAGQATYYRELLDRRCDGDVSKLCALVRRKEQFVLSRLDLTRGDPDVLEALRRDRINIAVATELNKVAEPMYRRLFLHDAVEQGLTARAVRVLRHNRARDRHVTEGAANAAAVPIAPSTVATIRSLDACVMCQSAADTQEMIYVRVHQSCLAVWDRDRSTPSTSDRT